MKKVFRLLLLLISCTILNMPLSAQERSKKKVAVYMTGTTSEAAYKKVIGAKLVNTITESGEYAAVERTADFLSALSAENDYQTSGEVLNSQIASLGRKFGAKYVVVADASELFDEIFIEARLINVESGLVEKSFDVSGPAESMAQLVSLSQQVAKGLFGNGHFSQTKTVAAEPVHMSLCAVKDGKVVFISPLQWQQMHELEKITYNKKGICLIDNGAAFVVAMQDSGHGNVNMARQLNAPTVAQLRAIYNNLGALNSALTIFGGVPLRTSGEDLGYLSSDYSTNTNISSLGDPYGFKLYMPNGEIKEKAWNTTWPGNLIRTVYKIDEIF